jgi:hypothetical protein
MTDVGEGQVSVARSDRQQPVAGDLKMDVAEQSAVHRDPLRELPCADVISGDADDVAMGGGGGQLTQSGGRRQQCGGVLENLNTDLDMATKQIPFKAVAAHSKAVVTHFTPGHNHFTNISPFEKKSWNSKASEAPFWCRLCQRSRPIGTMFIGIFPIGGTRGRDWQQICAESGVEKGVVSTTSCISKYLETISASAAFDREERQELEEIVAGACPPPRPAPASPARPCSQLLPPHLCGWI